jgi:exodeoxyribonuclease VII small subunit
MVRRPAAADKTRFEDALKRLEGVVERLEEGEIPLEEALKLFEEGVKLSRLCHQKLDEAEKRIELLTRDGEGKIGTKPLDRDDD